MYCFPCQKVNRKRQDLVFLCFNNQESEKRSGKMLAWFCLFRSWRGHLGLSFLGFSLQEGCDPKFHLMNLLGLRATLTDWRDMDWVYSVCPTAKLLVQEHLPPTQRMSLIKE
jgi:hypothetical protein